MRVTAERRADGVHVAAGVELIEPEFRHNFGVRPALVARLGDKLELGNGQAPARGDRPSRLRPDQL